MTGCGVRRYCSRFGDLGNALFQGDSSVWTVLRRSGRTIDVEAVRIMGIFFDGQDWRVVSLRAGYNEPFGDRVGLQARAMGASAYAGRLTVVC